MLDPQPGIRCDGAGHHRITDGSANGSGLAGDHGFVQIGRTGNDSAVGGHPTTGPDDDDIAHLEFGGPNEDHPVTFDTLGLIGEQRGERIQRGGGLRQ